MSDKSKFDEFVAEQTWSDTTRNYSVYMFGRLLGWMERSKIGSIEKLTVVQIKQFITEQKWGNSMARYTNSIIRQYARHYFGKKHPLANWKVKRLIPPPQRTLDADQVVHLFGLFQPGASTRYHVRSHACIDTLHPLGIRNKAIVYLLLDTGLRSAEVCSLEMKYLDMEERRLQARIKGGRWHHRYFSEKTADALNEWLVMRSSFFVSSKSKDRIFLGAINGYQGTPLSSSGLRILIRKLGKIAGLGPLSPHDFRRTFAVLSMRAGANPQAIKEAGGWSSIAMVEHYTRAISAREILPFLPTNHLAEVST